MIHLVIEIKVTYLAKKIIVLSVEIIVKATLALVLALTYFTSLYLTNKSTFDFFSLRLKMKTHAFASSRRNWLPNLDRVKLISSKSENIIH